MSSQENKGLWEKDIVIRKIREYDHEWAISLAKPLHMPTIVTLSTYQISKELVLYFCSNVIRACYVLVLLF